MPNQGDIYYALDTGKTYVVVDNAWKLQSPQFTGDVNIPQASTVATLSATGVTPGVYGGSSQIPVLTVDSKGRITIATTTPIYNGPSLPGGPDGAVQFNSGGVLSGDAAFTYDGVTVETPDMHVTGTISFDNPVPTFNNLSPLTTKGDLLTHDNTDNVRLGVGSDGQVLIADSASPVGLTWTTAAITDGGFAVPYYVSTATTYLLPNYKQAFFSLPIVVDGDIEIDGVLIELYNE